MLTLQELEMTDAQTPPDAGEGDSGLRNRLVFCVLLGLQAGLYGWAAVFFRAEDLYMAFALGAVALLFAVGSGYMLMRAGLRVIALARKPASTVADAATVSETITDFVDRP